MPAPSPSIFYELVGSLPASFRQTLKAEPVFACLDRELRGLEAAIAAVDQIERIAPSHGTSANSLVARQAACREARAFWRAGFVANAITTNFPTSLERLALSLIVIIAAGRAGPAEEAEFPWTQLRKLLAALSEL